MGCQSQSRITLLWNLNTAVFFPVITSYTKRDPHWEPEKMYLWPVVSAGDHRHLMRV